MARTYLGYTQTAANADLDDIVAGTVPGWIQAGAGAIERTVSAKLRENVSVFDFMTTAQIADVVGFTHALDHTAAIQAASDAVGAFGTVEFPTGFYAANGLEVNVNAQRWVATGGYVIIYKNANGPVLTVDGDDFFAEGIQFRGVSATYTGNNVELYGQRPILSYCGSLDAAGNAVYGEDNGHIQIKGQRAIYETADASGTGFDIHLVRATYAVLHGLVSTQNDGGIKFTDSGSQSVTDCQFGKYSVLADASPAGVNGGKMTGCRVLGAVTINLSNSVCIGNQMGASANVVLGTGTGGHLWIGNLEGGGSFTNNGNVGSSFILRSIGTGADMELVFGDDASLALLRVTTSDGLFRFPRNVRIPNNMSYFMRNAADDANAARIGASAANNLSIVNLTSGASNQYDVTTGGVHQFLVNSVEKGRVSVNGLGLLSLTAAQRDALTGLTEGTLIFNTDSNKLNFYTGAAWEAVTSA
jgi:hypothetical protein